MTMTHPMAVVLFDGEQFVAPLADTLGVPVHAVSPDTVTDTVTGLASDTSRIICVSAWPWPAHQALHDKLSEQVAAYRGVVSWHQLPGLARALADVLGGAVRNQAHVLFTSPDPGRDAPPETLMFLPQLAEQVSQLVALPGRSIAWRGTSRKPSSLEALNALIDAHDVATIVECPVVPAVAGDETLRAHAESRGVRFIACDLGVSTRVGLLQQVIQTVEQAEWLTN